MLLRMRVGLMLATMMPVMVLGSPGHAETSPRYSAKVPSYIQTPARVKTRLGTLKFFDGLPDKATVQKVYDNIDFSRGVEAFLSGIPAASIYAACQGMEDIGLEKNRGIGITENLMDARS